MIAKITLENFFSFGQETTIELSPEVNVLVGINGSGKSNLLKAIKLLYDGVIGQGFEKTFLKEWGGFDTVGNFSGTRANSIKLIFEFNRDAINDVLGVKNTIFLGIPSYRILINKVGKTSYYLSEVVTEYEDLDHEDAAFLTMENGTGIIYIEKENTLLYQEYPQKDGGITFKSSELALRQISDPDRFYTLFMLKRAIEQLAIYDYFDTTLKSPIRQPSGFSTEDKLLFNGQNLVSILQNIKNNHSLAYDKVEGYIKKINPHFKDISFGILGSKVLLFLREKFLAKSVSVEHISDGSLRYLLLLSIFLNPERGGLLCIDEPEIGLHPDMINSIAETIKIAAKDSQIIIASHSPLLLNAFDLDEILIFEKDEKNQTVVRTKSEEDFEDWNDDYLTGQLWLNGLIGGTRW